MSLSIGRSLREGIARTGSRNGLLLAAVYAVVGALNLLAYNSALTALVPEAARQPTATVGPALSLSPVLSGVLSLVLYLVSMVVVAAALRTFVTDETATIPGEYLTRSVVWVVLNLLVGYVVFFVALWIGFVLLFVPGLFLLVSLFFWFVVVAVEDENFVAAFRESWTMTKGNRWSLLGLGVIVMVVASVVYGVTFGVAFVASPWIALVVFAVVGGLFSIFSLATTARAYVQLADADGTSTA